MLEEDEEDEQDHPVECVHGGGPVATHGRVHTTQQCTEGRWHGARGWGGGVHCVWPCGGQQVLPAEVVEEGQPRRRVARRGAREDEPALQLEQKVRQGEEDRHLWNRQ